MKATLWPFWQAASPNARATVGLAGAGWSERDTVLPLLDPFAARQFQNQRLVERRLRGEVEGVEALGLWKARQPNAALDVAPLTIDPLQFAQAQQIARIIGTILRRFHGDFFVLARGINLLDYGCIRIFTAKFVGGVVDLYEGLLHKDFATIPAS